VEHGNGCSGKEAECKGVVNSRRGWLKAVRLRVAPMRYRGSFVPPGLTRRTVAERPSQIYRQLGDRLKTSVAPILLLAIHAG
jgi:hypothetical protein